MKETESGLSAEALFQVTKEEFRRLTRQQEQLEPAAPLVQAAARPDFLGLPQWFRAEPPAAGSFGGYRSELDASVRVFCDRKWTAHRSAADTPSDSSRPHGRDGSSSSGRTRSSPLARQPRPRSVPAADSTRRPASAAARTPLPDVAYGVRRAFSPVAPAALDPDGNESAIAVSDIFSVKRQSTSDTSSDRRAPAAAALLYSAGLQDGSDGSDASSSSDSGIGRVKVASRLSQVASASSSTVLNINSARARLPGSSDRTRYDFDASSAAQPDYPFKEPFSPSVMSLDFTGVALQSESLCEDVKFVDDVEMKLVAKLMRLAKLQLATRREEDLRRDSRWSSRRRQQRNPTSDRSSAASERPVKASAAGSRSCCFDCLQPACAGDCAEKRKSGCFGQHEPGCPLCRLPSCDSDCVKAPYDWYERRDDTSQTAAEKKVAERPKSCTVCSESRRTKVINANLVAKGRPRSGLVTYAASRASAESANPSWPPAADLDADVVSRLTRIGIDSERSATRARSKSARLRGRDTVLPGKSIYSQRRRSLTTGTSNGLSVKFRRVRSAKS